MDNNLITIKENYYRDLIKHISIFLSSIQNKDGSFPGKTNYGYTFSALLWTNMEKIEGKSYEDKIKNFLHLYQIQEKNFEFPWEFNNYALLKIKEKKPQLIKNVPWRINKNIPITNWQLLRIINFYRATGNKFILIKLIPKIISKINSECLIRDEKRATRSFQYHTFSTALLGELYLLSKITFFLKFFLKGTFFIEDKIMPNGRSLYLGRGQEQIFGYSALVYCLELAQFFLKKNIFEEKIIRILKLLKEFQRPDGSIPLVLNKLEKNLTVQESLSSEKLPGWYEYNTIFDYLPFAGVYLSESYQVFQRNKKIKNGPNMKNFSLNKGRKIYIFKEAMLKYEFCYAVPTSGKGYYSDELPIPFIVLKKGIEITPIYGGDPYWNEIYTPELIPLPYGTFNKNDLKKHPFLWQQFKINLRFSHWGYKHYYSKLRNQQVLPLFFANQLSYKKIENGFIGRNFFFSIKHIRKFKFYEEKITVLDTIFLEKNIEFKEFYPVNLFSFHGEVEKKESFIAINNPNFLFKIENIKGEIEIKEHFSPLGNLFWIKEKLSDIKKEIYTRKITIFLIDGTVK